MTATAQNSRPFRRPRLQAAAALTLSAGLFLTACGTGDGAQDAEETVRPTVTATSTAAPADGAADSEETTAQSEDSAAQETSAEVPTPTETTSSPAPETTGQNSGGGGAGMLGQPTTEIKQASSTGAFDLEVTNVRVGAHDGFDRVVFEFSGEGQPGWYVTSTAEPRQQGSGHLIDYAGSHALNVMINGTPYPFDLGIPEDEWPQTGPVAGAADTVQGVSFHGIFEATSQYVIGLDGPSAFSVTLLEEPTRVVVDVAH
ncbi:MAG: hypothetical protein Q4F37_02030 [Corynebacterium sp.]|nr:hypothetical protein [Corynebacterium sp.]